MAGQQIDIIKSSWLPAARRFTFVALFLLLLATLITAAATRATQRDIAVPAIAVGMESLLSPGEVDETSGMFLARELGYEDELPWMGFTSDKSAPADALYPVEGLSYGIAASEIEGMSDAEARHLYFDRMAGAMYASGGADVLALADDPALRERIASGSVPLMPLFADSNRILGLVTVVLALVSLGVLAPFVLVRFRHKRLLDASIALVFAALAGIVVLAITTSYVTFGGNMNSLAPALDRPVDHAERISYVAGDIVSPLADSADDVFSIAVLVGIAAMAGALFWRRADRLGTVNRGAHLRASLDN